MPVTVDLIEVLAIILVALVLVFGLGYLFANARRRRPTRMRGEARMISATIIDYFRRSGVDVNVGCITLDGSPRYTAFIESEPMKRFRLSHIVEATLIEYVMQTCKLELDKVYWRFPIREEALHQAGTSELPRTAAQAGAATHPEATAEGRAEEPVDDYINEGLIQYQHLPQVEATELSWEKFQEVAAMEAKKGVTQQEKEG